MAFGKSFVYRSVGCCMKLVVKALLLQVTFFISRAIVSTFLRCVRDHTLLDYFCKQRVQIKQPKFVLTLEVFRKYSLQFQSKKQEADLFISTLTFKTLTINEPFYVLRCTKVSKYLTDNQLF